MELDEAMRHTPSCRYFRNDRSPDDVQQRLLHIGRFTSRYGNSDTQEHDLEWSLRPAPRMVLGQHSSETPKIAITQSLRARYGVDG